MDTAFGQGFVPNDLFFSPVILDYLVLLSDSLRTFYSPYSSYVNDPYSSYSPFEYTYQGVEFPPLFLVDRSDPGLLFTPSEQYNPVSFLNSGYPEFSLNPFSSLPVLGTGGFGFDTLSSQSGNILPIQFFNPISFLIPGFFIL